MTDPERTDAVRYPGLSPAGARMLTFLSEHPQAPRFTERSGHRLTPAEVETARREEETALTEPVGWRPGELPPWLPEFVARCQREVPHYRGYGLLPWEKIPACTRADLCRDIARFVPDHLPLDRLMHFQSSGTTGQRLLIPSHPTVASRYLGFHRRALRRHGVELRHGAGEVAVALLGWQRRCFTYWSVAPTRGEAGLVKLNLHPENWRCPEDRAGYLEALQAEVLSGDPLAFSALLEIPARLHPRALLCTSMALSPGLRRELEQRFDCPVVDLYSMNEVGPIAMADPDGSGGFVLLQARLYVEIVDAAGRALPPGESGEICLTGGFNPYLPLLRYRTRDFARLDLSGPEPVLRGFHGRPPVRFRTIAGEWINNLDVAHALAPLSLPQYTLHQAADGSLLFRWCGQAGAGTELESRLREVFGAAAGLRVEHVTRWEEKVVQFTSALPGAER